MWLSVDRIEGDTVVMIDDEENVYEMSVPDYTALAGIAPCESDMLNAEVSGGRILSLDPSEEEKNRRLEAARARRARLLARGKK